MNGFLSLLVTSSIIYVYHVNAQTYTLEGYKEENSEYNQTISLAVSPSTSQVLITMTGANNRWMGIGWNAQEMENTYAMVADGESSGTVSEYKLAKNNQGQKLPTTITILSNVVNGNQRIVKLTRNITVRGADYYDFPTKATDIQVRYIQYVL